MDKIHSNFFATAFCAAFLLIVSLGAFGQTITINDVTAVNDNEVLIGGTTTDIADGTLLYSYYGTTNDEYSFSMGNAAETNGGVFQINVTALQPGTNYYFQVRDDASGARSNIYEFQTTGTGSTTYTVTTGSHNVSFEIVTLFGTVTPYSSGTIDKVGFIYATDPSMLEMMVQQITIENTMPGNFIEGYVYNEYDGEFKAQLDNLMPDADYYYQACVRSQENGEQWIVANSYESLHTEGGTSTGGNVSWVTIGSDDSSIGELPVNGEYNYSLSQQIYTNAEIDRTGTITKIALYNGNPQMTRTINLYMVSTYKQNFSDLDDWESVSSSNLVFSGEVTFLVSEWTEIELNTPFEYDGTGNIIVVVDDNTGNYESAMNFSAFEATGQSIYVYSDYTDYDATDLSAVTASSIGSVKNQIKFGFMDSSSQTSGDSVNWITIGAGNSTNQNLPVNSYYDYSFSQQIYTYAEIGHAGTIESVAFYNTSYETTRTIDLYMYNTDRQTFTSTNDWEFVDPGDLVFSGEVTFLSDEWTEIPLNTPFEYDGLHNIIIVADDNTVIEATSLSFRVFSATSQAIYYSDYSTDIDPTYLNGTTALDVANVKSQIKFGFTATNPTFSYVDLGLTSGTLWATMNVGAERPEDFGTYFAWGETTTKTIYDWASYTYAAGEADDAPGLTKYCNDASLGNSGFTDELTVLQASDDAATANLGSNWRMPTYDEILELTSECQYSYTTQNGVYGIIVTGPNSNTIFIPAAGGRQFENEVWEEGSGSYWVNSLDTNNPTDAQGLYFESNGFGPISIMRRYGLPIRPVYVPSNTANNQNGNVIFQCDFEDDTENANWTLNTGGQTNYWEIGIPSMTNAEKSLYITNGNGNEYTNSSASYAYAYREVGITEAGNYQFEFDWMANGESNYDNLRAFFIPTTASPNLTDGESNGMTSSNNDAPTGWIDLYSQSGIMAGQSDWQHNTKSLSIDVTGTYYLVFFWKNDGSDGNNPPATVDNIVVSREQQTNANTFTDTRDGKTYSYVTIGNQTWMAENLRYEGNIPLGSSTSTTEAYRYNPNDDADNVATYGYLYNWTAAMNGESSSASTPSGVQGICPNGWHLPSIDEWLELADALDGDDKGSQLAGRSDLWTAQALTNSTYFGASGFDALPAGYYGGAYQGIGRNTYFWCATESALNNSSAFYQGISYDYTTLSNSNGQAYSGKDYAYSVRCVKDAVNTASYQTGSFTDTRDGRSYDYVVIGEQTWMAENLRYDNSGSMTVALSNEQSETDPYLYYPNGDSQNLETYGYLYNWPAAMNGAESSDANPSGVQGICPDGWHLPSNAEWTQLVETLGEESNAGAMLAGNANLWTAGTLTESEYFGTSSFNALPSGYYYPGDYGGFGSTTSFLSTTEDIESNTRVYLRGVDNSGTSLSRSRGSKTYGFSVRCVKDGGNTANNNTNSDDIIYQSDFENTGEWNEWTLNNGDQTNKWTIGLGNGDASSTETNSLYITNDGSSYNYNNGAASTVYAYKEIELSSTSNYHILFDWKCIGEESWDYLRAFIIPASENPNLSAGNVIGDGYEDANTTPDGWIDLYDGEMSSSDNQWRNAESTIALSAGNYYLVFYWRNDESAGSNPPAAVDNIFIYKLMPISVTTNVSDRTSTSVTLNGTITFAGEPENIAAGFKWGNSETSLPNNITTQSTGATFSEQLTGLISQTTYYYQAYAVYDGDTAFSEITQFRTALDESSAGGANNPLLIGDISDWQDFSNALQNPSTVTYKGVMLADYGLDMYFSLESDLSFTDGGTTFSIDNFKGNLNGNYNTITVQPYQTFTGLFANFSDGHIDNLNLRMNSSATLEGAGDFGVLCQNAYQAYISNCTVSGISSEELSSSDDGHHIGGLVGYAMQTTISGCTNNLKIVSGGAKVGGIAGKADGTIMYCTNNAELSGSYVGGIMAEGAATITNCLNTGRINCSDEYAGGISGTGGTIVGCMNIGEISATGTQKSGGIIGNAESTTTVTNCANYGVFPTFSSPMGGIAGSGSGTYSHNVSAPLCRSTEQAIYSLNEIYATVATEESEYNSASETDDFFDEQVGDIKVDSLRLRFAERGTPKTTAEIVGSQLSGSLSSQYWDFTEDLYPKPQYINETSQTIVARIPIYLGPHQSVFGVWEDFTMPTSIDGRQITWASNDNAISISGGTATVTRPASGEDDIDVQITADYDGYTKTFVVRVIAPKHIPVYTGDASQDSVINLTGEFDNDTEGTTYAYDYGFQYSTTSADLSENVTTVQSTNLNHTFFDGRAFSYPLANIPEGTMIYYRAYATTADGTEYGDIMTHKALGAPVVVAKYPMWRTDNSATILFDITLNEEEDFNELENAFYYGTERNNLSLSSYIYYDEDNDNYSVDLHDLAAETKYYYVAEVTNDYGTTRSDTLEFLTYGTMTDSSDYTHYYTIQIGDQTWMAQNLKYAGDGVSLGATTSDTDPYYYYVNGDEANTDEYGYLYNWAAAMNGASSSTDNPSGVQGICPNGWHLPSNAEWSQLTDYLGGTENAGAMLSGQPAGEDQYWQTGTLTESVYFGKSGFNALPAGDYSDPYNNFGINATFWTATERNSYNANNNTITNAETYVSPGNATKSTGYAVRCVKNLDIIVATNNATNITPTSAVLNGSISNAASSGITARGFMFGTDSENLSQNLQSTDNTADFTYTLSDLTTATTYYFKAYATVNGETMYGDVKAFMTPSGVHDNYAYVDLGLPSGTMWATINLGAESFIEAGNRYAWGETTTKDEFTQSNYTYSDNPTILPAEADAAAVNWQGDWRMPTYEELLELKNNCTATWIQDIEDGMLFTGPNGNSIFLHIYTDGNGTGYYWSSSIDPDNSSKAMGMSVYASTSINNVGMTNASRYFGDYIRPVYRLVPTVATLSATDVSSTSAVLHGRISNIGNSEVTARGFEFGTSSDNLTETLTSTDNTDEFSYTLSELEAGHTYYFRAFATNSDGTSYDEVKILMTPGGQQLAGHDYVDLGLPSGIMWATCNVGATSPEEEGNSYAWGETTIKDSYSQDNYTYSDNPERLPADHDAAAVVWGGGWHMPTSADFEELVNNCTLERTTLNDVDGYVFTGPNGNSIFMRNSYYWSSSLVITTQTNAYALSLNTSGANVRSSTRTYGDYVRGVYSVPEVALSYPVWRDSIAVSLKAKYTINGTVQSYKYYTGTGKNSLTEVTEGVAISSDEHLLTVNVYNLSPRAEYWAMAEIVDEYGTYRSDTLSFYTYGSFVDSRNNTTYYTIQIGDQTWMAQNLKYAGDEVSLGTTTSETEPYYYYVNGNEANSDEYGYLYNWAAAMNGASASDENPSGVQGICPNGWHLPSDAEWTQLTNALGGTDNAGAQLAGRVDLWNSGTLVNSPYFGYSGLGALPAGGYSGAYADFGSGTVFWSTTRATEINLSDRVYLRIINYYAYLTRGTGPKYFGYSVRCVKGTTIYAYDTVNYCGEQYTFGTQTLTATGDYEETFTLGTDKDSIVYLHLTMYPALVPTISDFSNGCYGENNGYVEVSATGGAGTYTYNWNTPDAQTTARVNNLGAGEYSVTVTDAARCTATVSQTLTAPEELSASINGNNPNCFGDATTLTASANGGTTDYSYAWSSGESTSSITVSPTATTTYTVTVTDANNCTATASKNIVVNTQLTVSVSGDTQVQCFGDNTATLTANADGGSMAMGYTYAWSNSQSGQNITGVGAGTYSVTVTDGNGCTASANATVTGPTAALSASTTASSNVSCNGASDGSATVTANGGTPDYTYLWSNNATTPTVNGLAAGTYNVTVTDANSCTAVTNTTITQPEALTVTISGEHEIFSSANVCAGAELQLIASIEDSQSTYETPYYAWERGMNEDPSDTNSPIIWTRMNFGDYGREGEWATCDICERLAFTNCEDISYGANDGFENYNDITIVEVQSPTAPAYTHYYYRVIVAGSVDDLNGNICISTSNTFEINVTRIAEIEFGGTNAICEGGVINLAVTETSPAGTWSIYAENGNTGGPFNASITNSGTNYSVVNAVHDEIDVQYTTSPENGGCWNQKTIPIYSLPEVTITPENTTICEGTDVTLHPSSNQQSSFQWSGGPSCSNTDWASDNTCADWTVNPITTTTYTLTVTTSHDLGMAGVLQCESTESKTVTVSPSVELNVTPSHIACNGESNGTVTVAVTSGISPYTYEWSDNADRNSNTATGIAAGNYEVTVTDANSCSASAVTIVTEPDVLTVALSAGEILCNGGTTNVTATPNGGTSPYAYAWQGNSSTESSLSGVGAGTYSVTVTDSHGCTATASTTVNVNDQTVPELTGTWPSNITGQNNCFANADISELLSNDAVEALYEDCSGITVSHTDANTSTDNCGWTITRTYTIQDPYGNTVEPNPTMSVSGSDQSAPELTGTWPANITGQDNCFANADISGLISDDDVADLYSDGCGGTVTVSHSDASTLTDNCGWTITRTYTIRDACGNETTNTMSVSGSDQSEPALAGTWPDNITGQDNCFANADLSGLISDDEAAAQYIDGCGGSVTVSHSDANTLTDNCGWTITRTYTITNACGTNSTTITQSVSGSDQSAPTLSGTWPANITAQNNCFADADISGLMDDDDVAELYSDGCGGTVTVSHSDANTLTDNCGWTITRTYTITNACGTGSTTNTQSVSGGDQTVPAIGDDNLNRQLTSTNCVFTVPDLTSEVRNIASDNCTANGNLTVSQNITAGTEITTATTVIVTVTDQCGNNSTKEIELTLPEELTTSLSSNPATIACNGGTTSITNTPDGGAAPYQYFWSNSTNEQNLASVTAGTYTVTVRDNNGCSVVESLEITQPNALTTSLSATSILCNGQTSNITNTVAGGTLNYTYNWNNGATTQNLEGVGGGTYSVTVTDANSCVATASVTVNEPEELTSELSAGTIACNGSTTDITNTVTGGTTPITYEWNNGANTQNLTGVVAGTYSVTVRDNNSCSVVREITITQPNVLAVSVDAGSVACNGSTTTASAVLSGGTEPYEYQWSNSATTQTITDIIAGTYSVTVTDDNGCSTNAFATITQPEELTVSISGPTSVCQNTTSTLTANVQGGTADFTYSWSNSATTSSITTPQLTTATEYSVTVTDANNCSASASVNVEIGDTPGITIADVTPICVGGNTMLQANVSNAGTGYTVEWSSTDTGAGLPADITTETITVAPTSAGTYTYTVSLTATSCSDGQPFTSSDNVQLLVNGLPDAAITNNTNETTITCSTTQISLTATGGNAYQWSNGGAIADNNITSADTYTVTVTDANGCSNTESIVITENVAAPTVNIINETGTTLLTCTTTTINVEATGTGTSYLWSNEVTTATNAITTGGTYTVTATADNGCTSTAAIEITPNADAPTVSITNNSDTTVLTCSLTSINVTATGSGTSYEWSNGANTAENTLTAPGTYTVTATAGNGCSASEQITITQDIAAPEIIASATDSTICQGASTTISAIGGNSYTWSPETGLPTTVGASITATPTATITYTVTGIGTNGCTGSGEITITVNQPTSSEFSDTACDSYEWNNLTYTETGDFTQTFTNANGCDSVVTLHLTINHSSTGIDEQTACDSYEWIDGVTYTESTDVPTFTLRNAEGCDSVVTLHLTINNSQTNTVEATACDLYEWAGETYTESGTYNKTFTAANGCDSVVTVHLTINHAVTGIDRQEACETFTWIDGNTYTESTDSTNAPIFTLQNTEGCDSVVSLYLVVNHSTTSEVSAQMCSGVPYTYEGETFTEAGTYTVTLTNSHGCDSIVTLTITYANNCGGIVSGIVTDENNGEPISNARVTVGNQVTRTNAEGQFSIDVLRGRKALRVSATGYISYSNMVDIQSDTVFNISLNAPHIETDVDSLTVSSYPYLEQSDSITLINTGSGTLVWSSITEYDNLALVEDSVIQQRSNTRSLWDSIQTFATRENAEQAIATDGFFIYTSSWMRPGEFNRYTPNGEYVETFYVENVGSIRNLSYDGTHFYGTEGTNIIFKLDLDNQTLVDSIETDIQEIRHCSFNKQDGSLLAGSWNSLYRIDIENGTSEQIRNDLANVYSSAFDNLSPGGPYLWLFSQTSQNNGPSAYIRQFNISTGEYTDRTHYLDDINLGSSSLAGGICASEYVCEGKFVLLADVQNPMGSNTIATYEIGRTNNVVRTGKKSGSIAPNSSENISVKASATETGDYSATIRYRAAVMGAYSRDIDVNISAVAPECDAVQQISIVTDTFHTVTLDWQPVELGNYESVSYLVFNTASQYAIDTVSGTTVTYDGLSVGEHCFSVMALSQAGYTCLSAASDTVCAEIQDIPCNIPLAVEARSDGESITISWNMPVGVDYVSLYRNSDPIDEHITTTSYVDTNVVPEVTYCYTVIAYFEGGICDEVVGTACTKIVSGVCAESPVLQIEAVGYSVHLNWTVTSDSYTYKIFRNDVAIGMTTDTTYFDNVNPGYNYCYKVESLCEYGMFTYSNEECVFVEVISEDENGQGSGDGDAIDEWTADNLTLYPNPTYGQFFIEGQRIAVVQIFNASGMLVTEIENTEAERITINCDSWNPELYNIRIISTEGETATRKVTIFR